LWTVDSRASTGEQGAGPVGSRSLLAGRYRPIEQIGIGGMAVVYLAEDQLLMRKVAIKLLNADSPAAGTRRFVREAKIGAALNHPNLVTVFDAIAGEREVLIVMEYVDGPDVGQALKRGPLRPNEALSVLENVAGALDHAHGAGIIHRDVKPSNILLAPDGCAKLTDLGIARALADTATTSSELVVGSIPYMSPEQLTGRRVGPPADVYALALTAFEMLSGERARHGTPEQIKHQVLEQPPPDLRELQAKTPPAAAEVLKRGMARNPSRRPRSATALVRELGQALDEHGDRARVAALAVAPMATRTQPFEIDEAGGGLSAPPPAERVAAPRRRGFPWRAVLALGAVVALIAAAIVIGTGDDAADPGGERRAAASEEARGSGDQADGSDGGSGGGETATAASGSPERAVQDFYGLAATGDFEGAAATGTSNLSAQLGDLGSVFDTLESIEFTSLETVSETADSAQLEFATVATHTDRTESCTGTATAVASGGEWLVDSIDGVSCETTG
jgi:eukaryotic-like serine/threonine-protein kinase